VQNRTRTPGFLLLSIALLFFFSFSFSFSFPHNPKVLESSAEDSPQVSPDRSLRKKKIVIIDPGHGGLETGAKGKFGTEEKNVTLAISQKLKNIIERNLAFRVILTRDKDIDVSLDRRAAIANNNRSDVFISIHINGSYRKEARGAETFFLSKDATDEEARRLAYLENSSAEFDEGIMRDNQDEIQMILWDMAQAAYLKQSSQLAEYIQKELNLLQGTANRGIKQAPFKVLTGVACPAVLVEVAFLSNPDEERRLGTEEFQQSVARAIYSGLANYIKATAQD
jgi:N-acetylmuramoyl-L-alanine amidase